MKIKLLDNTSQDGARIESWPLVNVGFCVLTFFVLTSLPLAPQAFNINVPLPRNSASPSRQMLIVSIDIAGQTYIEQQPVTREQLSQTLVEFRQTQPEGLIVLYAPKLAVYSDVVQVLDLLRSVGGDRVALATLPDTTTPGIPPNPGFITPGTASPPAPGFPTKANPNLADPLNPYGTSASPLPIVPSPSVLPSPSGLPSQAPANQPYIIPGTATPAPSPASPAPAPNSATPTISPAQVNPTTPFNSASPGMFSGSVPATTPAPSPSPQSSP